MAPQRPQRRSISPCTPISTKKVGSVDAYDQRESDGVLYERIGPRTRVPCNTGGQRALKGKNGATGDATEKLEIIRVR